MKYFKQSYIAMLDHMRVNDVPIDILDIGCKDGYQSELFIPHGNYIGVEAHDNPHHNDHLDNVQYISDTFPSPALNELSIGKTLTACMSLGWYDKYGNLYDPRYIPTTDDHYADIAHGLTHADHIYIRTSNEFANFLKEYFSRHTEMDCSQLDTKGTIWNRPDLSQMLYIEP